MNTMSFAGAMPAPGETARKRAVHVRAWMDHAGWIIAAGAVGAMIAGVAAVSRPYVYRAHTLIQIHQNDTEATGAKRATPFDAGMLRSRTVVGPVVERLRLDVSVEPLRAPLIGGVAAHLAEPGTLHGPWPESLGYAWGGERLEVRTLDVPPSMVDKPLVLQVLPTNTYRVWRDDKPLLEGNVGERVQASGVTFQVDRIDARPGTRFVVTRHDTAQTIDTIARDLRIDSDSSDLSTVRIAWENPSRTAVAPLVNGIAESYIAEQAGLRREEGAAAIAYLTGELPRVQAELERAEAALTRYRAKEGTIQPSQDAQSYLNGSMDYQRQIAQLKLERTKALQRFTEESNEVKTIDNQIQQLARERRDMDSRLQNLSVTERKSVALTRDVKVAEDTYLGLRNRLEQLTLASMDRAKSTRVVDAALMPASPVGMSTGLLTAGGGLLGVFLAMGLVSFRQRIKPVVANLNDAEASLGLPMLGDICYSREQVELERLLASCTRTHWYPDGTRLAQLAAPPPGRDVVDALLYDDDDDDEHDALPGMVLHDHFLLARNTPHSMAVEGLRNVRAALHFTMLATGSKSNAPRANVIAVTSPTAGAGKTFVSVNLAVLFAEAGKRVLLIDADLRRGRVASWFDQHPEPGLSEVLAGRVDLSDAVRPTIVSGLSVLSAGAAPTNPSELLMQPSFVECLDRCAARFDLVMIDTTPVLAVADAALVANLAGSTLLVLRAESTLPSQAEETLKRLARADAHMLGGILNGVTPKRSNRAEFGTMNPYLGMPLIGSTAQPRRLGHAAAEEENSH